MSFLDCPDCGRIHCEHQCGDVSAKLTASAILAERERVIGILYDEARRYSREREPLVPAEVVLVFANAVVSKARQSAKE